MEDLNDLRHRLRNCLNTITVNAELLKLLISKAEDTEAMTTCAIRIVEECKNCATIIGGDEIPSQRGSPTGSSGPVQTCD